MGLILKTAAGVIIGLLMVQIIMNQRVDVNNETVLREVKHTQVLRDKYLNLTGSIETYYRKRLKLPEFISDLECVERFSYRQKIDCALIYSDGIFYVNFGENWASAEPYILNGKVFHKCKTSISFDIDDRYYNCLKLDVNVIPNNTQPPFDCKTNIGEVEKIICLSDRLIASENNLSSIYKELLSKSPDNKQQLIKNDQSNFIERRRKKCRTSKCINTMTRTKITKLDLMGVFKK